MPQRIPPSDSQTPSKRRANLVVGGIVAAVIVAAIVALMLMAHGNAGRDDLRALVHDADGATHELSLSQDGELVVSTELGVNVVVVQDGAVFVREADCDGRDCVRQGALTAPGKQIICLPHKLWIEVVAAGGRGSSMDVNAASDTEENLDALSR